MWFVEFRAAHPQKDLVILAHVTRWLTQTGRDWQGERVDFNVALAGLASHLVTYVGASPTAHAVVSPASLSTEVLLPTGFGSTASHEAPVERALLGAARRDWHSLVLDQVHEMSKSIRSDRGKGN